MNTNATFVGGLPRTNTALPERELSRCRVVIGSWLEMNGYPNDEKKTR